MPTAHLKRQPSGSHPPQAKVSDNHGDVDNGSDQETSANGHYTELW